MSQIVDDHPALRRLVDLEERLGGGRPPSAPPAAQDLRGDPLMRRSGRDASRPTEPSPPDTAKPARARPEPISAGSVSTARRSTRQARPMGYQPALDGLRAVSVIAVVLYHAGFNWMSGGFFGVEVFFVVSGFLITSLLLDERERSGRTNLGQFWLRRARRLLPALFATLVAVAVWAALTGTDEQVSQLRRDFPWAIFYVGNWGQILGDVPYYAGDPPLLRHLWSLAVEEQWYLVWPLLFVVLGRARLTRRASAELLVAVAGGAMFLMFLVHRAGPGPMGGPIGLFDGVDRVNFIYLSTLTRFSGILLGAAAAFVWRPWRGPSPGGTPVRRIGRVLDIAGMAAVAALAGIASVAVLTEGYVYQWLLALVSVLSLVAVLVAVHPAAAGFRAVFSWRPMVEVGKRSYGLYLWSWPIFVFAGAYDGSVSRFVPAMVATVVVAEASYRYVEIPVRKGALGRWLKAAGPNRLVPIGGAAALGLALVSFYGSADRFDRAAGGDDAAFVAPVATAPGVAPGQVPNPAASAPASAPAPRRVVVVGDSQAYSLAVNLPEGIDDTFTITNGSVEGCSVYRGGEVHSTLDGFNNSFSMCEEWTEDWVESAVDADAEIALVVLGAWDVFDLETPDGEYLEFGTGEWDDYVVGNLQTGIDALSDAGAQVALLEIPCMRPQDVTGAFVPALPERGDDARVSHLNELWRRVAAANPGTVTFVDGPSEWCGDETVAADLGYRWDGVHYYKPGANLTYTAIAPALLAL